MSVDTYGKRIDAGNFQPGVRPISGTSLTKAFAKMLQGGLSRAYGLVAHAGGGQASALQMTTTMARVETVATGADSLALPKAIAGSVAIVTNAGANSMNVFAKNGTTDVINALANNTAFAVAAGKSCLFLCSKTGQWDTLLTA